MSSPAVLDFPKLLADIPGDNPAGGDLRADRSPTSLYYLIKDARNAASTAERKLVEAEEGAEVQRPDWKPVLEHGTLALAEKSKDLEVVAYVTEALLRLHGYAGLRDGFRLARELVEKFWDRLYPLPDEEGITTRVAALTHLNGDDADGTLILPLVKVPVTQGKNGTPLAVAHYQSAQALAKIPDPKVREKRIAGGAISVEMFQKDVADSTSAFYNTLAADLTACQDEYAKLGAALDPRCNGKAPPSSNIRNALTNVLDVIKDVARAKLDKPAAKVEPAKDGMPAAAAAPHAADVIRTRDDAFRALEKVADFFQQTEPHSVVSFALEQVVRWGRMPLPDLLTELIPDEGPRKSLFQRVGIKPPEPPPKEKK